MKILLIGNGFDLEHHLPTTYKDFLAFCVRAKAIFNWVDQSLEDFRRGFIDSWEGEDSIKEALLAAYRDRKPLVSREKTSLITYGIKTPDDRLNELYACIQNNGWLEYFLKCSNLGENWIDFESEISNVVRTMGELRAELARGGSIRGLQEEKRGVLLRFLQAAKGSMQGELGSVEALDQFTGRLLEDLNRLIRALEIYIAGFVREIEVKRKSPDIEALRPDCVLSFNYSNTYQRLYDPEHKLVYDYIHGKADMDHCVETSDLVLGIDEYLEEDHKNTDLEFLPFKKYFQRIYKSTGNAYLDWCDAIQASMKEYQRKVELARKGEADPMESLPWQKRYYLSVSSIPRPEHTLYIFGHSLDVTDGDVLRRLICNDNVQTKIYYHRRSEKDKTALGGQIKNLIKIIGQDELIRRTGGPHKTITFLPQTMREAEE